MRRCLSFLLVCFFAGITDPTALLGYGLYGTTGIGDVADGYPCEYFDRSAGKSSSGAADIRWQTAAVRSEACNGLGCPLCKHLGQRTLAGQQFTGISVAVGATERGLAAVLLLPAPELYSFRTGVPG